jgi:hypothetical protein
MMQHHMSTTVIGIVLAVVALGFYGLIVLYGAWIDGKRQKVRDKGKHPVTTTEGKVEAREDEDE